VKTYRLSAKAAEAIVNEFRVLAETSPSFSARAEIKAVLDSWGIPAVEQWPDGKPLPRVVVTQPREK